MSENEKIVCSFCKAEYVVPKTVVYATCPYCGTTFRLGKPDAKIEHYIFSTLFDKNYAYKHMKEFALMQIGVVEDFEANSYFDSSYLYFVPLYLYEVNVKTKCVGGKEVSDENSIEIDIHGGEETAYIVTLATNNVPFNIPSNYTFPARERRYFKPTIISSGIYLQPAKDPYQLLDEAKKSYLRKAIEEAKIACGDKYKTIDNSKYVGLAHYPFWLIKYRYKEKIYKSIVDASDGTILYMEYPMSYKKRVLGVLGGIAITTVSMIIASILSLAYANTFFYGLISGFIASLPGLSVALHNFVRSTRVYRYKPEEELVFLPTR